MSTTTDTRDDELRWEFYRSAMAAWVEAAGRAPVPAPRTSPEERDGRVPR
ncbi:hypothetical protein GCM10023201_40100 [Actinomycetospora corticicola]|uniref:Uncharacterized protein n=1 Tax=Actinomycetospora corticicola TaxID=663602 RepID=A0A7Y9J6C5_9PSEU|nr:hypothetical protein [Actinomycetospora corticicola]NYD36906.1 hypothetical protein [Actinomycetospora corticicola]